MAIRLAKVAKELNVGVSTIVEFLQDKGYDIENKPSSKLSEAMHTAALQEFSTSAAIKEEADKLQIGQNRSNANASNPPAAESVTTTVETPQSKAEPATEPKEPKESPKPSEPAESKTPVEDTPVKREGPKVKVVGKIDLGSRLKPKAKTQEKAPKKEVKAEDKPQKPEAKAAEPKAKQEAPKKPVAPKPKAEAPKPKFSS